MATIPRLRSTVWFGPLAAAAVYTLLPATVQAATKQQIDAAITAGVKYLLSAQEQDGAWRYPGHDVGGTSLVGLALVESGVKTTDPAIARAAEFVRRQSSATTDTYSVALAIMFLDRLEDRANAGVIAALGERLRNSQNSDGSWSYSAAASNLAAGGGSGRGDNSNTQFALLALWVARRNGVEVSAALARTDKYFRGGQAQDGGWNYTILPDVGGLGAALGVNIGLSSAGSMTCAGLLGLAAHHGSQANELQAGKDVAALKAKAQQGRGKPVTKEKDKGELGRPDPRNDPAVQAGLKCLGQFLAQPPGSPGRLGLGTELYFLWSVERVGVTYGVQKIGPIDWYAAGSDYIVAQQQPPGFWSDHSQNLGTSFALLFLNRANVAPDLTALLTGKTPAQSDAALRSSRDVEALKTLAGGKTTAEPKIASTAKAASKTATKPQAAVADMSPAELLAAVADADAKRRDALLIELRDRKGAEATLALAEAIGKLPAESQAQARRLLVERLTRMTSATLGRYLEYDDVETRLAAAKAAAAKKDASLGGQLVDLLSAGNAAVADAAHAALVEVTGQDFGRFQGARAAERMAIIQRWRAWRTKSASPK